MSDTLEHLGKIIPPGTIHSRDAVHIAVAPVEAGATLRPGWPVGLAEDGKAYTLTVQHIGIVDPFLPDGSVVEEGRRFWLFLYPGAITSLRHVWTHPAFQAKLPTQE